MSDYIADRLSGYDKPKLHLVAFNSSNETAVLLSQLAEQTGGHYHKFISSMLDNQKVELYGNLCICKVKVPINIMCVMRNHGDLPLYRPCHLRTLK